MAVATTGLESGEQDRSAVGILVENAIAQRIRIDVGVDFTPARPNDSLALYRARRAAMGACAGVKAAAYIINSTISTSLDGSL
jgi:hypothetical protein